MIKKLSYYSLVAWILIAIIASIYNFKFINQYYFYLGKSTIWILDFTHFVFYGIMGILFTINGLGFISGVLSTICFAISLELLQTFSMDRNADIKDVVISIFGWLCGYGLALMLRRFYKHKRGLE
ncbi:MAG TPA: VanZ family protein [bacterium]